MDSLGILHYEKHLFQFVICLNDRKYLLVNICHCQNSTNWLPCNIYEILIYLSTWFSILFKMNNFQTSKQNVLNNVKYFTWKEMMNWVMRTQTLQATPNAMVASSYKESLWNGRLMPRMRCIKYWKEIKTTYHIVWTLYELWAVNICVAPIDKYIFKWNKSNLFVFNF